jgi:hypothetical protein
MAGMSRLFGADAKGWLGPTKPGRWRCTRKPGAFADSGGVDKALRAARISSAPYHREASCASRCAPATAKVPASQRRTPAVKQACQRG